MPEIDFAFLADSAETQPGHKFQIANPVRWSSQ